MKHTRATLPLDSIRIDGGTQARVGISDETVTEYSENPAGLPPLVVFHDGAAYWLADGFHRLLARRRAGLEDAECEVYQGSQQDALWFAIGANRTHGLKRSNADKRKAVELALQNWPEESDSAIAEHVGVSHPTVGTVRSSLVNFTSRNGQHSEPPVEQDRPRRGRDGRTINTANIGGKKPKKPEGLPPLSDAGGRPVPDNLRDVFCDHCLPESLAVVEGCLGSLKDSNLLQRVKARARFLPYLKIDQFINEFEAAIASLSVCLEDLQTAVPYAVCPYCEGTGCQQCRSSGYLPQWRKEEVEREGAAS